MIPSLTDRLFCLLPALVPLRDFVVATVNGVGTIVEWHSDVPQPTADQLAAVTQEQVDAARLAASYAATAAAALSVSSPIHDAARMATVQAQTDLNNVREMCAAILSLIGKTPTDLQNQIDANRVGKTFEQIPPTSAAVVADMIRIPESVIVARLVAAIHAGYGDPIQGGP